MTIQNYILNGFKLVGKMTKDYKIGKKKHNVYVTYNDVNFDPLKKKGVYIIAEKDQVLKIGESENLKHRFQCYESHTGNTNIFVRESMREHVKYDVYFIECPSYVVGFAGVQVDTGISYKALEKQLLRQYKKATGSVPIWNKGIQ
jgi:hypothetical protein